MTEWPETPALRACIHWNETERKRALYDAREAATVPNGAVKYVNAKPVPLTVDEFRAARAKDAERYAGNIRTVKGRL
jgi:hypothetical protein